MKPKIKIAFASGTDDLNLRLIERMRGIFPELPLYVVSEFPPVGNDLHWVRYRGGLRENLARCRSAFHGKSIRLAGVILVPNVPFRRMRVLAFLLSPLYFLAINENLNDFMLRPRSLPAIARHCIWRVTNYLRWHLGGNSMPDIAYGVARLAGWLRMPCRRAIQPDGDGLRKLARTIASPTIFRRHWNRALKTLHQNTRHDSEALKTLWRASRIALSGGPTAPCAPDEELFFALADGTVTVHAGKAPTGKPRVMVVSAYLPFPLSHGGAVRIHNLTKRAAHDWDQILVCFVENESTPPPELLELFVEVVLVRRAGSHNVVRSGRPEVVEQFASPSFGAALRQAVRKWQPVIAQLEFTQMAQYASDCAPARTILVEHDITFDLYQQLAKTDSDWDLHREVRRWRSFEQAAWRDMSCVVTMSAKDQALITGTRAMTLPNGVDLDRFRPSTLQPEPRRLLFVGSFSHLPNMMALEFFLREAWPELHDVRLHIIAGAKHEYFLDYQSRHVQLNLNQPGIEVEGFVSDVRTAYQRAAVVIAPLVASAGTNLKILEAMACGRTVVSTPAGVNGLDLTPGTEFILANTGHEMATAITSLFASPEECARFAAAGRRRVEESYGWDAIAERQNQLYRELCARI